MWLEANIRPQIAKGIGEKICKNENCKSKQITEYSGEWVCKACGRVQRQCIEGEGIRKIGDYHNSLVGTTGYKRKFYFHERCVRWICQEPPIPKEQLQLILKHANSPKWKDRLQRRCSRKNISKLLHDIDLPVELSLKFKSRTTNRPLTSKRFININIEKWKSLQYHITKIQPVIPSPELVECVKRIFYSCQIPFDEVIKHGRNCDKKPKCYERSKKTGCRHNFPNINCFMRFALQICELRYGFKDAFYIFKNEFPLISDESVIKKLRPFFLKLCQYNEWPVSLHN